MAKVSIIYTHWASTEGRSELMRKSILSLIKTVPPETTEILVADNGGSFDDSKFLLELTHDQKIARYVRYRKNMWFYYARNDCLAHATGNYLCISDNDIIYRPGWLEECIGMLDKYPDKKMIATPLLVLYSQQRYTIGELDGWTLNSRAGSNSWVMRRKDYEEIGNFYGPKEYLQVAGTLWTNRAVRKGYVTACMPEPKALDMGKKYTPYRGYSIRKEVDNFDL